MHRVFYSIEDYFEDHAHAASIPWWLRRLMRSAARTAGEAGDLVAFR
jgi:hypothetical protein